MKAKGLQSLLVGIVFALFPLGGSFGRSLIEHNADKWTPGTIALVSASILFCVGFTLKEHMIVAELMRTHATALETQTNELKEFILSLQKPPDFEFLGPAHECFVTALNWCDAADEVHNTLILFADRDAGPDVTGFKPYQIGQIKQKIESLLRAGKTWVDIVSPETLFSSRLDWLKFAREMIAQRSYDYRLYCLNQSYPAVNFMLMRLKGVPQRVCVGWGHHEGEPDGNVFSTTKSEITASFDKMFRTLQEDSRLIDLSTTALVANHSIVGHWLTGAYGQNNALKDFAHVHIRLEGREIRAVGHLFDIDGIACQPNKFEFVVAYVQGSRLWFVSESREQETIGWYDFRGEAGTPQTLSGHLDPGDPSRKGAVFGVRLSSAEADRMKRHSMDRKEVIGKYYESIKQEHAAWIEKNKRVRTAP